MFLFTIATNLLYVPLKVSITPKHFRDNGTVFDNCVPIIPEALNCFLDQLIKRVGQVPDFCGTDMGINHGSFGSSVTYRSWLNGSGGVSNHDLSADCLKLLKNTKMSEYNITAIAIYALLVAVD